MTAHPYPQKIRQAVAVRLAKQRFIQTAFQDLSDHDKESLIRDASDLLTALWEASRVDTVNDIEDVPERAIVLDRSGFCAVGRDHAEWNICSDDYPAHILHWGGAR